MFYSKNYHLIRKISSIVHKISIIYKLKYHIKCLIVTSFVGFVFQIFQADINNSSLKNGLSAKPLCAASQRVL